ncbi:MAG: hypothetical protein IPM53_28910 [Anaerolineaceae bacterium]|nr:hypothetical protein [Anaerolineaceae bacterium]
MVFLGDLLVALLVAVVLVAIFGLGYRRARLDSSLFWFFLLLFLATWAGGVWLTPLGPPVFGISWLSFVLAGVFFTLLIMAIVPLPRSPREGPAGMQEELEAGAGALFAVNLFFWILLIGFFIVILVSYFV